MREAMKHRLVGAAVLIAGAVILWPLVFDTSVVRSISERSEIPDKPAFERFDVAEPTPPENIPNNDYEQRRQQQVADAQSGRADRHLLPETARNAAAPSDHVADQDEHGLPVLWAVQLGLFNQAENAHQLQESARAAGFHVVLQKTTTVDGDVYRVFSEPKLERAASEQLRDQLNAALQLDTFVTRYYP